MTALISVTNVASGRLTARFGARAVMLSGLALAIAGCLSLLTIQRGSALVVTAPLFAMTGCGIALTVPAMMATAFSGQVAAREGTAAGVLNSLRQAGAAFGVGLMVSALAGVAETAMARAGHGAIVLAFLALLAATAVAAAPARSSRLKRLVPQAPECAP